MGQGFIGDTIAVLLSMPNYKNGTVRHLIQ